MDRAPPAELIPRKGFAVSRGTAFWFVAYLFAAAMLGNTLPTPLYVIYQARWLFSSGVVTLVFATYAAGVLLALLLAGRSSDQVGRRPVLTAALALSAVSSVVFIFAGGLSWLFAGRLLSGLSAGLVTGTATAALADLAGGERLRRASTVATVSTTGGLGLGPLVAGFLAEHAPNPTVLAFEVHLALLAIAAIGLAAVPETVPRRGPLTLRFAGLRIPPEAKRQFLAAAVAGFTGLSVLGLFAALAPSFLRKVLELSSYSVGGFVVFLIFGVATMTQIGLARYAAGASMRFGLGLFIVALGLLVLGLRQASLATFLGATVVGGVAVGSVFIGSLGIANALAPREIRAQVMSAYFTASYLGLTVPVIAVGFMSDRLGFFDAVFACSVGLTALCAASFVLARKGGRQSSPTP